MMRRLCVALSTSRAKNRHQGVPNDQFKQGWGPGFGNKRVRRVEGLSGLNSAGVSSVSSGGVYKGQALKIGNSTVLTNVSATVVHL